MLKKKMVYSFAAVGLMVMTVAGAAWARSVLASSGHARIGSQASCFNVNFTTGAVDSTCNADFIVPLTTDTAGAKPVNLTARATAPGAICRTVANNRFATSFSASPGVAIAVSAAYVPHALSAVVVPAQGVFFVDCITNPGTSLLELDYVP